DVAGHKALVLEVARQLQDPVAARILEVERVTKSDQLPGGSAAPFASETRRAAVECDAADAPVLRRQPFHKENVRPRDRQGVERSGGDVERARLAGVQRLQAVLARLRIDP